MVMGDGDRVKTVSRSRDEGTTVTRSKSQCRWQGHLWLGREGRGEEVLITFHTGKNLTVGFLWRRCCCPFRHLGFKLPVKSNGFSIPVEAFRLAKAVGNLDSKLQTRSC